VGATFGGCNALGEAQLDVLPFHELEQPFPVSAQVAADFGEGGEFLAFGLRDIEYVDTPEPVKAWLLVVKLGGARVISRTSAMRYKDTSKNIQQVGRELSVDAIVEGTIVRSGNRIRITAQLIQVSTDMHLWADSFERDISEVLTLQQEVAPILRVRSAPL